MFCESILRKSLKCRLRSSRFEINRRNFKEALSLLQNLFRCHNPFIRKESVIKMPETSYRCSNNLGAQVGEKHAHIVDEEASPQKWRFFD